MKILKHAFKTFKRAIQRGFHKEDADKESQEEQTETKPETKSKERISILIKEQDINTHALGAIKRTKKPKTEVKKGDGQTETALTIDFEGATVENLIAYVESIAVIRIQSRYRAAKSIPTEDEQKITDVFGKQTSRPKESDQNVMIRNIRKLKESGMSDEDILAFAKSDI